jgi:hypothetical protein
MVCGYRKRRSSWSDFLYLLSFVVDDLRLLECYVRGGIGR